jgi:hypothetical protein
MYFMAAFLLCLAADMIDHIISLRCTRGGGATPSPPSLRTTKQPSTPFLVAATRRTRPTTGAPLSAPPGAHPPEDPRPIQRRQRHLLLPHYIRRPGEEVQTRMPVGPGKRVGHRELNPLGGGMIFYRMTRASNSLWWTPAPSVASYLTASLFKNTADWPSAFRR